jgi:hypothetical protein
MRYRESGAPAGQLVYGQLGGDSRVYVVSDGIHVSDAAGVDRVQLGNISGGDYGLRVVSADGSTVIIDGTSDMYRILASGTVSLTVASGDAGQVSDTVLSGAGAFSTVPIAFAGVSFSNAVDGNVRQVNREIGFIDAWVADSSGGSPTHKVRAIEYEASLGSFRQVTTQYGGIRIGVSNYSGISRTAYARYQLCAQAAL